VIVSENGEDSIDDDEIPDLDDIEPEKVAKKSAQPSSTANMNDSDSDGMDPKLQENNEEAEERLIRQFLKDHDMDESEVRGMLDKYKKHKK